MTEIGTGPSPARQTPAIVLVEPQMGENIGAAARVMHNFGLDDLRLVRPRDGWPNEKAAAMASGADRVLAAVRVYETTVAAASDLQRVYAATARSREMAKESTDPRQAAAEMQAGLVRKEAAGILFGPERAGLTNDDVVLADRVLAFPTNPVFPSLNLAQAVAVMAYEWHTTNAPALDHISLISSDRPATKGELMGMFEQLETALDAAGYFARVPDKRPAMVRNVRNIFQRGALLEQDVRTLRGVLKALERRRRPD